MDQNVFNYMRFSRKFVKYIQADSPWSQEVPDLPLIWILQSFFFFFLAGVKDENIIIKDYYVPHTVKSEEGLGQYQGHHKVKGQLSDEGLRNRKTGSKSTGFPDNRSLHQFKFTAIYEPANRKKVRGKWLFLNLLDDAVLLRTLPWYIKVVAVLAIIIDSIFKTHLVSLFRYQWLPVADPGFSHGGANPRRGGCRIKFN